MLKKLVNFYKNYDIRWKLKKISKFIGINIYPQKFKFDLLGGIQTYVIFNLIFFKKIFKEKKRLYNFIKLNSEYETSNINFLISPQSSGSNFLRQCINSYFEIKNKLGNGIPFYDKLNNEWINSGPSIVFSDMWRVIDLKRNINFEKLDENLKREFLSKRVIFSRHPTMNCDLYDLEASNINPLILIREPKSWIISRYIYLINNSNYYSKFTLNEKKINTKIIKDELSRLNFFYTYWIKKLKNKEKFLILNFDNLIENTDETIFKTLTFFKYENIDMEILKKANKYNSTDFIKEFYGSLEMSRFSNPTQKINIKNQIEDYINNFLEKDDAKKNFVDLINLNKKN